MEFYGIKKADLIAFAQENGVEVEDGDKAADLDAKLTEAGLTREDFTKEEEQEVEAEEEAPVAKEEKSEQTLVKMDRNNMSYRSGSHVFTRQHPFVVMDKSDAEQFVKSNEGFHIAQPEEAERFYS